MASGIATAGLALLAIGVIGVIAGLGLITFTEDDQATNSDGSADLAGAQDVERQGRVGQTVAVAGGAVAFLGLVFIVIGRAD